MLSAPRFFARLPRPFALQVVGADAAKVINNMSTNDLAKLPVDGTMESFITDVRGWVVAHAGVLKQVDRVWLWGTHASPEKIANHIDRYIIREDAVVSDVSREFALFVVGGGASDATQEAKGAAPASALSSAFDPAAQAPDAPAFEPPHLFTGHCPLPILGPNSRLLCCPAQQLGNATEVLAGLGLEACSEAQFEWLRISNLWPLHPGDIGEKTIPQELDRDQQAISFTKGCYLGQETIARLDARGQLQKKLCKLRLAPGGSYNAGDLFMSGEKEVGSITSLAHEPAGPAIRALAILRRGNFAAGTQLTCNGLAAEVIP